MVENEEPPARLVDSFYICVLILLSVSVTEIYLRKDYDGIFINKANIRKPRRMGFIFK